ncbi:MAG: hypothetical protein FWG31_09440 [Oscillospiraceae bacterium]|nr:hypothetical protein [Oscillospiraceae bacterium]
MPLLMCKDVPVYDINTGCVLRKELMPCDPFNLLKWKNARSFLRTNKAAESVLQKVIHLSFVLKRRLSLSDCYWIKDSREKKRFDQITPYMHPFVSMELITKKTINTSVPDHTLGGSFPKYWVIRGDGQRAIRKLEPASMAQVEVECSNLLDRIKFPHACVEADGEGAVLINNITNLKQMLIPFHILGESAVGYDVSSVSTVYAKYGIPRIEAEEYVLRTVLFDAIVGNYDRYQNMSNWAIYKDSDTGANKLPPVYDFNLAHLDAPNIYLRKIVEIIFAQAFARQAKVLLNEWKPHVRHSAWMSNLTELIRRMEKVTDI